MTLLFVKYDAMNNFVHEGHIKYPLTHVACLLLCYGVQTL